MRAEASGDRCRRSPRSVGLVGQRQVPEAVVVLVAREMGPVAGDCATRGAVCLAGGGGCVVALDENRIRAGPPDGYPEQASSRQESGCKDFLHVLSLSSVQPHIDFDG